MEGMNGLGMHVYIYTWKCHNETPCIAILKKQNFIFLKNGGQEGEIVLSGDLYKWEGGGYKERMHKDEYCGATIYSCMKTKENEMY
jgi:hypothetical protein